MNDYAMNDLQVARTALKLLDLTSLAHQDTDARIESLCGRAVTPHGAVAAVCIYPRFVPLAQSVLSAADGGVRVATVSAFPQGRADLAIARSETAACVAYGADEIDTVLPYQRFLEGDIAFCRKQLDAVREASEGKTLKVILETGVLKQPETIRQAARLAVEAGADFIKTSTGKVDVNATPEAAAAMLDVLADQPTPCGLKIAGGVRSVQDARRYLELAADRFGESYLRPQSFRFGASSLLDALLAALDGVDAPDNSAARY